MSLAARYRILGVCFLALLVGGVWMVYAVFAKKFATYDVVTLKSSAIGLQLPIRADVKIRGVIIGEVLETTSDAFGATVTLGLYPEKTHVVPNNVTGAILPKTLFGEKYVSLEIPQGPTAPSIKPGALIQPTRVATEVEQVLSDLYPLLETVQPADLNMTLTAIATALEGRGEKLGETLETTDAYLKKFNPELPVLLEDLRKTAEVADTYNNAFPSLAQTLRDTLITAGTLKEKQPEVGQFLKNVTSLSKTVQSFLEANETNIIDSATSGNKTFALTARYSPEFPCLLKGIDNLGVHEAKVWDNYTLHIVLETLPTQPNAYKASETPKLVGDLGPSCTHLPSPPWNQANPLKIQPRFDDGTEANPK